MKLWQRAASFLIGYVIVAIPTYILLKAIHDYDIKVRHVGENRLILSAGGVMITAEQIRNDFTELYSSGAMTLQVLLEAESPLKTLKRKHYNKLIKKLVGVLSKEYDLSFTQVVFRYIGVKPKFVGVLEEEESLQIRSYKIDFEKTQELQLYAKDQKLTCVGRDIDECFMKLDTLV